MTLRSVYDGDWESLEAALKRCERCGLCKTRTNTVPGEGNRNADILFIGEGPGKDEDLSGRPFVGAAGQLLDKMLSAIGLARDDVYIANIVKCRPPGNRNPSDEEACACMPYLRRQCLLIRPKIIVCLGSVAARHIIGNDVRITRDHGQWREMGGILMMPTFHPAALLYDGSKKRDAWADWQTLRDRYQQMK